MPLLLVIIIFTVIIITLIVTLFDGVIKNERGPENTPFWQTTPDGPPQPPYTINIPASHSWRHLEWIGWFVSVNIFIQEQQNAR